MLIDEGQPLSVMRRDGQSVTVFVTICRTHRDFSPPRPPPSPYDIPCGDQKRLVGEIYDRNGVSNFIDARKAALYCYPPFCNAIPDRNRTLEYAQDSNARRKNGADNLNSRHE